MGPHLVLLLLLRGAAQDGGGDADRPGRGHLGGGRLRDEALRLRVHAGRPGLAQEGAGRTHGARGGHTEQPGGGGQATGTVYVSGKKLMFLI